jgi:hypothetical protein
LRIVQSPSLSSPPPMMTNLPFDPFTFIPTPSCFMGEKFYLSGVLRSVRFSTFRI